MSWRNRMWVKEWIRWSIFFFSMYFPHSVIALCALHWGLKIVLRLVFWRDFCSLHVARYLHTKVENHCHDLPTSGFITAVITLGNRELGKKVDPRWTFKIISRHLTRELFYQTTNSKETYSLILTFIVF